ncbi:MAG: alpha/beta hydrolase [Bryobacterales bacterium]|nr:alpha/beta hydrolase [Bryobacterales bacterium]
MEWLVTALMFTGSIFAALALLLCAGLAYQTWGERQDARRFPPPGKFVSVDGQRLHYQEAGSGEPVVVLEAGVSASSVSWARVMPLLAQHARVIAYDRGGLAWSAPAGRARIASRLVEELHGLLEGCGARGRVVLVGHSYGGLLALLFACRYRGRVAGVVLVDPVPRVDWMPLQPAQAWRLNHGVRLALRGALLAKLGVVRFALALMMGGARRFPKAIAKASSGRATSAIERLIGEVRKLPAELWPSVRAHWCLPKTFLSMASHFENLPDSVEEYARETFPPQVPLTVLSAESSHAEAIDEHIADSQQSLVGTHRVVPDSGHWIHLDQPEAVVNAVTEMLEFLRSLEKTA